MNPHQNFTNAPTIVITSKTLPSFIPVATVSIECRKTPPWSALKCDDKPGHGCHGKALEKLTKSNLDFRVRVSSNLRLVVVVLVVEKKRIFQSSVPSPIWCPLPPSPVVIIIQHWIGWGEDVFQIGMVAVCRCVVDTARGESTPKVGYASTQLVPIYWSNWISNGLRTRLGARFWFPGWLRSNACFFLWLSILISFLMI